MRTNNTIVMKNDLIENLWNRTLNKNSYKIDSKSTWIQEIEFLYKLEISMEETLQYLYTENPSLVIFKNWINENKKDFNNQNVVIDNVFSDEELNFFNEKGYIILKKAISKSDCIETQTAIWDFLEMTPDNVNSWYQKHEKQNGLMVNFSNHPTLNKNRESLKIFSAFIQLYNSKKIYKSIDKISFNPPISQNYNFTGSKLHWDVSLKLPIPFQLQGLIYLSDCYENDGCFHCVPGFHNQITDWINSLPKNVNPRDIALQTLKAIPITGEAGDMVIWHQALPHCATPNYGTKPRMVQYLTYLQEGYKVQEEWI